MKKSRNSFFNEYPNPNMGAIPMYPQGQIFEEFEQRLAKIERQLNRLDHRISNLEKNKSITTDDFDDDDNLYMI